MTHHLERVADLPAGNGTLTAGPYTIRWKAEKVQTQTFQRMTVVGLTPPRALPIYRMRIETLRDGRVIDAFDRVMLGPEGDARSAR